uniref:Ig-like domain-containing protein n=1 Tax=Pelusios castaneus TaxID=367368 RepID=A0A8C8VGS0_9SAUR
HGYMVLISNTGCVFLRVLPVNSSQFTVTGPDHPIPASVGGEAVLPCRLSPRMSAEKMEVRWFRSRFSTIVHVYLDGQDQYGDQIPEYRGRTKFLKDDIANGSVSLGIRDIRPSDDGQYKCFFESGGFYEEALLELQVAALGSSPAISVEEHQDGGIRVACRSSGWYPEPKMLWRDLQGEVLPSASEKISPEADGLFQTDSTIVIRAESNQKVTCCVRNPRLNQERESEISIQYPSIISSHWGWERILFALQCSEEEAGIASCQFKNGGCGLGFLGPVLWLEEGSAVCKQSQGLSTVAVSSQQAGG